MIVDQIGLDFSHEGLESSQKIVSNFGSCLLVIGACFSLNNECGIYGSSTKSRSRYFIFGDPYNEDEVIEFLKLYQSSEGTHPDVDEQILNELIASYHGFKEKETQMELEDEDEDSSTSLWVRFREVTGFVPLYCWNIIEKKKNINETLQERLDRINSEIISKVARKTRLFCFHISSKPAGPLYREEFQYFLSLSRDNYLRKVQNDKNDKTDFILSDGTVYGNQRITWDLSFVTCSYINYDNVLHTPIALSKPIADGMLEVFLLIFIFESFILVFYRG